MPKYNTLQQKIERYKAICSTQSKLQSDNRALQLEKITLFTTTKTGTLQSHVKTFGITYESGRKYLRDYIKFVLDKGGDK